MTNEPDINHIHQETHFDKAINTTVREILKALQIILQSEELTGEDKIRCSNIALSEALSHYKDFLNELGATVSYTGLLQTIQIIHRELSTNPKGNPKNE